MMKKITVLGQDLPIKLSPSFLSNASCPAYLKFHYVDKIDERFVRVAAERGSASHASLAMLIEHCMDEKMAVVDLDDQVLVESLQKHLPHTVINEAGLVLSWLRLWRERFVLNRNKVSGVEEKISLDDEYEECPWDEASYRGIIDLIEIDGTRATIWDWKSQPNILNETELKDWEQGTMYCWLVKKLYPHVETFDLRLWYLRYGFYAQTPRSDDDINAFEESLIIRENKIAQIDNWNPIPGKHCNYCDFIHRCPLALDLSPANPNIITQDQAVLAAQRVTVMEALTKTLKAGLKVYISKNDNVMIGNKYQYGFAKMESTSYKVEEVERAMLDHDHQLSEVAEVNGKKMKKLLKVAAREDPPLHAALEDLAKPKRQTKFKGFVAGDEGGTEEEEAE